MSFFERLLVKPIDKVQSLFLDVKFIIFAFGMISALGFLLIYSFLYGYYYSGNEILDNSNFGLISYIVPFDLKTLSMTSIFFICIYYSISELLSQVRTKKENKWWVFFLLLLTIIMLNALITIFFANKITFQSILSFSLIWIFIGLLVWFLYIIIKFPENVFAVVKSMFFSLLVILILSIIFDRIGLSIQTQNFLTILIMPLFLLSTTIFQMFYRIKWIAFVSYLSFFFFFFILILFLIDNYFFSIQLHVALLIIPLLVNFIFFKTIYTKEIELINSEKAKLNKDKANKNTMHNSLDSKKTASEAKIIDSNEGLLYKILIISFNIFSSKINNAFKLILSLMLLLVFVSTPRLSLLCGQTIRMINLPYEKQLEVTYLNQNGVESKISGNYYIENNSTLYVSNVEWQLETIKPLTYHIKPIVSNSHKGN